MDHNAGTSPSKQAIAKLVSPKQQQDAAQQISAITMLAARSNLLIKILLNSSMHGSQVPGRERTPPCAVQPLECLNTPPTLQDGELNGTSGISERDILQKAELTFFVKLLYFGYVKAW